MAAERATEEELDEIRNRWLEIYTATVGDSDEDDPDYEGIIEQDEREFADLLYGFLLARGVPTRQAWEIVIDPEKHDWPC